jgi:aspartyl/asparaginyl beta-hydroxylase (cupin superfamily)
MKTANVKPELWFSSSGRKLTEENLGFYDSKDFPWVKNLEDNWTVIAKEINHFIQEHNDRIEPYFNKSMVSAPQKWKAFGFKFWDWELKKNRITCPETMDILAKIPNLLSASVSILEPTTEIHEHRGDTNAIYRCHLGLKIPAKPPVCGFKVNEETREWQEGRVLIFNDAALHSAWNLSKEQRYVLLLDVLRPEFESKRHRICRKVLAGIRMQFVNQKYPRLKRFPRFIRKGIYYFYIVFIGGILRFRKLIGV